MSATPGSQKRDFLHIRDAVEGLVALASTPAARGEVFNVGSGQPVTIRRVLEMIHGLVGKGRIDFGARPMRAGEIMELYADVTHIRSVTGWEPRISLEDGLAETVAYYRGETPIYS
jgi:nucleoside-diphosphate-sugar epimerase